MVSSNSLDIQRVFGEEGLFFSKNTLTMRGKIW
jgi:hypothetical protein